MSDREARAGLRALMQGTLVLSKEEGEQLLAVLLGMDEMRPRTVVRFEIELVKSTDTVVVTHRSRHVQEYPMMFTEIPNWTVDVQRGTVLRLQPQHAVNGHNGEPVCGPDCEGC